MKTKKRRLEKNKPKKVRTIVVRHTLNSITTIQFYLLEFRKLTIKRSFSQFILYSCSAVCVCRNIGRATPPFYQTNIFLSMRYTIKNNCQQGKDSILLAAYDLRYRFQSIAATFGKEVASC